jgi:4-amino-4-deoxy-L-arabinose transferase-like glycosyltransferase
MASSAAGLPPVAGWRNLRIPLAIAIGLFGSGVVLWSLGYPSFWDPDEAHYAQITREMLATREWLVPLRDGEPFLDKPVLFHWLQMVSFLLLGPSELAARVVPIVSAFGLLGATLWFGRMLFDGQVGRAAALMLAVVPATFALSAYAIVDMTFTLFLFGGSALVVVAALKGPERLQYPGYVLLAAAILTKGPVALALAGLAFLIGLALAPEVRPALLRLRWGIGLVIAIGLAAPWFAYVWWRFPEQFVSEYALLGNVWLYTRPLFGDQPSYFFYVRITAVGLLPWTPLLLGRLFDAARGNRLNAAERLLWAWTLAIVGFFSFSQFKLDHYVYPAAPALTLVAAKAWVAARRAPDRHWGVAVATIAAGSILVAAALVVILSIDLVPINLSPWVYVLPAALMAAGGITIAQTAHARLHPPPMPTAPVAGLLVAYAVIVAVVFPSVEEVKPVRRLARLTSTAAGPADHVAMYRLNRWSGSWRFYVDRPTVPLETPADLQLFLERPGRHYVAMLSHDYEELVELGVQLRVLHEQPGLFTTSGRALRRGQARNETRFIVVTTAEDAGSSAAEVASSVPAATLLSRRPV